MSVPYPKRTKYESCEISTEYDTSTHLRTTIITLSLDILARIVSHTDIWTCYSLLRVCKHTNKIAKIALSDPDNFYYILDKRNITYRPLDYTNEAISQAPVRIHSLFTRPFTFSAFNAKQVSRNGCPIPPSILQQNFIEPPTDKLMIEVDVDHFNPDQSFTAEDSDASVLRCQMPKLLIGTRFLRDITVLDVVHALLAQWSQFAAQSEYPHCPLYDTVSDEFVRYIEVSEYEKDAEDVLNLENEYLKGVCDRQVRSGSYNEQVVFQEFGFSEEGYFSFTIQQNMFPPMVLAKCDHVHPYLRCKAAYENGTYHPMFVGRPEALKEYLAKYPELE